uniref:Sensor of blue light, FAD-binding domain n=1 Tax=Polaromonas sp. H6N TaxID=1840293 RepID=A0A2S1FI80_9BURK|nr:BLUF domain-containing protein [Polaromonas sp. H6N]AWD72215.1 sensor of blue light, FAD-binding domain [Polaromonas sp. H6N]
MLTRIIYVSRALSPMPLEIKDILLASRKNNPVLGITGALCFLDSNYLQYLEGEASTVNALYQKIEKDPRHSHSKILVHDQISQRAYPKWSMALLTWNEETKAIYRLFNPDSALDAYATDPASVPSLLEAWARTPNWMTL